MQQHSLYIQFLDSGVTINSNSEEVLVEVARCYRAMVRAKPERVITNLEVFKQQPVKGIDVSYCLLKNGEVIGTLESFSRICEEVDHHLALHLIQSYPQFLWLHSGAAACNGYAILFPGSSGCGKSTLVASLRERGWSYLTDDILPLDQAAGTAIPFPRTIALREYPGRLLPYHRVKSLKKTQVEVLSREVCPSAMPIKAIIFPTWHPSCSASLVPLSRSRAGLELVQNCLNFVDHGEEAVRYVCNLIRPLPTFQLYFHRSDFAAQLVMQFLVEVTAQSNVINGLSHNCPQKEVLT